MFRGNYSEGSCSNLKTTRVMPQGMNDAKSCEQIVY